MIPTSRRAVVNLRYEPENQSSTATVTTVQSALRMAEAGDTRQLFALYRDLAGSGSHVYCELSKRKLALLGQEVSIQPWDKEDGDDVAAAEAVKVMIEDCGNWLDGLTHLMDSVLWPVTVVEKIYAPAEQGATSPNPLPQRRGNEEGNGNDGRNGNGNARKGTKLRFSLKRLEVVNPTVLCFRQPYLYGSVVSGQSSVVGGAPAVDPDSWEADLRFYKTGEDGRIVWNWNEAYLAEPMRHVIHRGHLMVGQRDNYGGPMRTILFWWLLGVLGRDWFARYMERYGAPWPVARTDAANAEAISFLKSALSLSSKIGALIVDHDTQVDLAEAMTKDGADAYDRFLSVCNREISKVILGQTLSAEARPTGLGSGTAALQGEVREEFKQFDAAKLGETCRRQIFKPFLEINGLRGRAPKIVWGGLSAEDAKGTGDLLVSISQAGLEPTDEALPVLSERVGFQLQRSSVVSGQSSVVPGMPARLSAGEERRVGARGLQEHPSDGVAARKAKALSEAYRGALAPVRQIILSSSSAEEAVERLRRWYPDWRPERVMQITEEALQLCALAGAEKI